MKIDNIQAYMFCSALPAVNLVATTPQVSAFKIFSEKVADILILPFVFLHLLTNGKSYDIINVLTPYLYGALIVFLIYTSIKIYKNAPLVDKKKKFIKLLVWTIILGLFITYIWFGVNLYPRTFTLC